MRPAAPLILALALLAPLFASTDVDAKPRKRLTSRPAAAKKPEIKLKDAAVPDAASTQSADSPPPSRGPTRIDFDDRLVQGQTNKSGSVYLYDRKELKTRSMVKKRESFREEIVGAVYDSE